MKVAVVHNLKFGGAHRRASTQLQHMTGVDVTEYTLSCADPMTDSPVVRRFRRWADAAPQWAKPPLRYLDMLRLFAAYKRLSAAIARDEPDVIWLNGCQFLQTPFVRMSRRVGILYHCDEPRRTDYDEAARRQISSKTKVLYAPMRWAEKRADRATVASVDIITTNSRYGAQRIQEAYRRRAEVVYCGVDSSFVRDSDAKLKHVMSVGTLIPSKGHDLAIDVVAASGVDLPLVVVGSRGTDEEKARLRARADKAGVELRLMSGLEDAELVSLYQHALATIYLAVEEPFGLVSIEAQACGCPPIVSDEGGLPETLEDGVSGWTVPRTDTAAAARVLKRLVVPEIRDGVSADAVKWSRRFSWAESGASIQKFLEKAKDAR